MGRGAERRPIPVRAAVSGLAVLAVAVFELAGCGTSATPAGNELPASTATTATNASGGDERDAAPVDPDAALGPQDLAAVLAAAAERRVTVDNSFGGDTPFGRVEVVETVGATDANGFLEARGGRPLTDDERVAIVGALDPLPVEFVPAAVFDELDPSDDPGGRVIVTLAEPAEVDGRLVITSQLWCGGLCGTGGAHELLRRDDGTWTIGDPVGSQWIS